MGPSDPTPRCTKLVLLLRGGERVTALDDSYSDRIRCDHPTTTDGSALADALLSAARRRARGRIVALVPTSLSPELEAAGFELEARMPGYYGGVADCVVLCQALDPGRALSADREGTERTHALLNQASARPPTDARPPTQRATVEDAADIAGLITAAFTYYPTPSGVPGYVASAIAAGVPFRLVRDQGRLVACASADLVREARTAELTDCVTLPSHWRRGLMQALLLDLMDDLRALGYPTAYTLARAIEPGMNLAFRRLGFELRGCMTRSCRIGAGIEDMNVLSRAL